MSTVQGAADFGPKESASDQGSDSTLDTDARPNIHNAAARPEIVLDQPATQEEDEESLGTNGLHTGRGRSNADNEEEGSVADIDSFVSPAREKLSSADGSVSTPDDTPSIQVRSPNASEASLISQNSALSSPGRRPRLRSPRGTLKPFDKRFQARLSPSPLSSPRPSSPAFLTGKSRRSPVLSQIGLDTDLDAPDAPWEVVRWTKLRKLTGEAFSELGKRNYGRPTCIAVSASIAIGTSKGMILIFDYHQNLKATIGVGTKAIESGPITSVALSADHSVVAGGHTNGTIFTWEIARPAKPFLHIPPVDATQSQTSGKDGHITDVSVLHLGFLGTRHTALVSADDRGMAFSHLASRGMGAIARTVHTTRTLGRYPDPPPLPPRPRKPSSVLAFAPLPLGNTEAAVDSLGLVGMLTPYLLVVVSTTPVARTQHKASRPKELTAHGAMSAALAWYPPMKSGGGASGSESQNHAKLAYCWLNVLTVIEVVETESDDTGKEGPPELNFKPRRRWKAEESIVAMQWLSRSVLAVITITQQLVILEDGSLQVTDTSDLIKKHIYQVDLFSQQLSQLVETLDEENESMHGVVANAFYMSFKAYKGRLFLLGFNDVSIGTLSNWADRLLALMEHGDFIGAIKLATSYYIGDADRATVGLPAENDARHDIVQEKLLEMMSASLKFAFGKNPEAGSSRVNQSQLERLAQACFTACLSTDDLDFLFEDVYNWYAEGNVQATFLRILETYISDQEIRTVPPTLLKDLVADFVERGENQRLEEIICRLSPDTMDLDQITALCKRYRLYDALFYIWSQAIGDYTTILKGLIEMPRYDSDEEDDSDDYDSSAKIFPYLSYILTGRVYPTGELMSEGTATKAKAEVYHFLFSGSGGNADEIPFRNLRATLDLDSASFMSMLNEAFEDSFLNGATDLSNGHRTPTNITDEQRFGLSLNRQYIITILLEILVVPDYSAEDVIYLDIFIARNLPKFPQFLLLPGSVLHRVLIELCDYPTEEVAEDCQLSVEYLLSVYQPPDLPSLIPPLAKARFYRVIKSIYRSEKQYALLLKVCFEDTENPDDIFDCISQYLGQNSSLNKKQTAEYRGVIINNADALLRTDLVKSAITLDQCAPDLHETMTQRLESDEHAQYQYLREVLEPRHEEQRVHRDDGLKNSFVEQYVRLLCDYDRRHVADYVDGLKSGDLRLQEVLPALESSGVVDAAVILMAREGKIRQAIDRLMQHLKTLEVALVSLLEGAEDAPDAANTEETTDDLMESLEKYVRVGVWLCQGQSQANAKTGGMPVSKRQASGRRSKVPEELFPHEYLWLDLIDTVVRVTRNASEVAEAASPQIEDPQSTPTQSHLDPTIPYNSTRLLTRLRNIVQDTFTALLAATSVPTASNATHSNLSFLRILRAFLSRASESSPSLAHLRSVLSAVFAAYAYEEELLALANRLLDKDLFVRVEEISERRQRGWRPLGQVCGGCGARVWGPGVGAGVWEAWLANEDREAGLEGNELEDEMQSSSSKGKGKATDSMEQTAGRAVIKDSVSSQDALVVFSCRHLFHRRCLEAMSAKTGAARESCRTNRPSAADEGGGVEYRCPLETDREGEGL